MKKGILTADKYKKTMSVIKGTLDYRDFKDVDAVIEVNFLLPIMVEDVNMRNFNS